MTVKTKKASAPEAPKPKAEPVAATQTEWEKLGVKDPSGRDGITNASLLVEEDGGFTVSAEVDGTPVQVFMFVEDESQREKVIAYVNQTMVAQLRSAKDALLETDDDEQPGEPDVAITESGAVLPVEVVSVTHLHVAQMTPEIAEGETELPTDHQEGSIVQFKGLDRRTMRLTMTNQGLRAVAVESEAANG